LPLALFGSDGYPSVMGRLASPSLIAQALAPWIAAVVLERLGSAALLTGLLILAILNVTAICGIAIWRAFFRP
jgi:hypothetical protein